LHIKLIQYVCLGNLAQLAIDGLRLRLNREIRILISNWFSYNYDASRFNLNEINDGGNDMFDGGNRVRFCFKAEFRFFI